MNDEFENKDELPEDEDYCLVNGNYALLLSAFKNIAENGCKYSPNNHVKVSLSFIENKIVILFSNICVTINQNEIDNLFQPFMMQNMTLQLGDIRKILIL